MSTSPMCKKLIDAACAKLNPIAGTELDADSDAADLLAMADAAEEVANQAGLGQLQVGQLVTFIRANC